MKFCEDEILNERFNHVLFWIGEVVGATAVLALGAFIFLLIYVAYGVEF